MRVVLASDHAGFEMKSVLLSYLADHQIDHTDLGPFTLDPNDDYPDFVSLAAKQVSLDPENTMGVVIGGSGQGEAMCANRLKHVRAGVFYGAVIPKTTLDIEGRQSADPYTMIRLMREHDNANVLSLAARFLTPDEAVEALALWLKTPFSNEARHARRIAKLDAE
jgi:ribose 5-phosphate isomerase B